MACLPLTAGHRPSPYRNENNDGKRKTAYMIHAFQCHICDLAMKVSDDLYASGFSCPRCGQSYVVEEDADSEDAREPRSFPIDAVASELDCGKAKNPSPASLFPSRLDGVLRTDSHAARSGRRLPGLKNRDISMGMKSSPWRDDIGIG